MGGVFMATSSITKDFIVKDVENFERILKEVNNKPSRIIKTTASLNLERGSKLLKQFSFR